MKVINNIKSKLSNRDRENKLLKLDSITSVKIPRYIKSYSFVNGFESFIAHVRFVIDEVYGSLSDHMSVLKATRDNSYNIDALSRSISEITNDNNNDLNEYLNDKLDISSSEILEIDIRSLTDINKRVTYAMKDDISGLQGLYSKIDKEVELILKKLDNFKNTPIDDLDSDPEYIANVIKNNYLKFSEFIDTYTKILTELVSKISSTIVSVHNKINSYYDSL